MKKKPAAGVKKKRAAEPSAQVTSSKQVLKHILKVTGGTQPQVRSLRGRRSGGPVLLGTDFSGLDMMADAMEEMAQNSGGDLKVKHVFACDNDVNVQKYLTMWSRADIIYGDILLRNAKDMLYSDVYTAGAPCQGWSQLNKNASWKDARSQLMFHSLKYVKEARPAVAILEQVASLKTRHAHIFMAIVKFLEMLGYRVHAEVVNTSDHFLPQRRRRLYMVAIQKELEDANASFHFPTAFDCVPSAKKFLDKPSDKVDGVPGSLPSRSVSGGQARARVIEGYKKAKAQGYDPAVDLTVVDQGASKKFGCWAAHVLPCITRTQAMNKRLWCSLRGRAFTLTELARYQGLDGNTFLEKCYKAGLKERSIGGMIGNTMSKNVLQRILGNALPAAGLLKNKPLDMWEKEMRLAKCRCQVLGGRA